MKKNKLVGKLNCWNVSLIFHTRTNYAKCNKSQTQNTYTYLLIKKLAGKFKIL
uniref:Uncharacterized protein n=1 Tax=Rhizophora mucronata TaxID=61149 RepID=A0A2P2MQH2_RHIMU